MKPNILLVLPDQLRGDWIEPISTAPVRTPNVLALNDLGTNFTNTWTPSPICASARACIATGRNYDRSPVQHNNENMPLNGDTFYRRLADAGYDVVTAGKIDLLKGYMDWGDDGRHMAGGESRLLALGFTGGVDSAGKHDALRGRERGASEPYMNYLAGLGLDQIHFEDYKRREPGEYWKTIAETTRTYLPPPAAYANTDLSPLPEEAYCDNWIGSNALSELERLLRQDDPWFLTVNFAGPHEPLDVTSAMRERWKDVVFPPPYARVGDDHSLQQTIRQNYASMIELIDTWLGRYMRVLEEAGVLSDTLVVFASDHGEMLGDYNFWGKAVPFEPSIRVPLIIAGPECRNRGAVYEGPVSLLDLPVTLLDFAGCANGDMEGVSLRPVLENGAAHSRKHVFTGLGNWRAVCDGRFKLVAGYSEDVIAFKIQFQSFDPETIKDSKLYDLFEDPWQEHDVSAAHPEIHRALTEALTENCSITGAAP